jgi:hypothetical protein
MGALELSLTHLAKAPPDVSIEWLRQRLRTLVDSRRILDQLDAEAWESTPPDLKAADTADEALLAWCDAAQVVWQALQRVPMESFNGLAEVFKQAYDRGLMSDSRVKRRDRARANYAAGRFVQHKDVDDEFRSAS